MTEQQVNLRRAPLPTSQRMPYDQFRYGGIIVVIAAVAALAMAIMMRPSSDDAQGAVAIAADLPQIN